MPRVLESRLEFGILEFRENLIGRDTLEVGREELVPLLGIAIRAVRGVAGLDLGLLCMVSI
jgi:hypothetical protein